MSQFEYTDLNKFFVSVGVFLIGFTFVLPWLFFQESFELQVLESDLELFTKTAKTTIEQRQEIISYFPLVISIISIVSLFTGICFCYKGISGWSKNEKLRQESMKIANDLGTKEAQVFKSEDSKEKLDKSEITDSNLSEFTEIPINNLWHLNHWGSDVCHIENKKIVFRGEKTRLDTEGSNISLKDILKLGKEYKISCFTQSKPDTTGMFQLWCHDNIEKGPHGFEVSIPYAKVSTEGEFCSLRFKAQFNQNIRIHLQYKPGKGQIEVSKVRITEIFNE
jgi:hypothetical protein